MVRRQVTIRGVSALLSLIASPILAIAVSRRAHDRAGLALGAFILGALIGFVYIWAFSRFARGQVTRLWVCGFALLPSSSGD